MKNRFFCPKSKPSPEDTSDQRVAEVSTIVWECDYSNIQLKTNKKIDEPNTTDLILTEVKEVLSKISDSTPQPVYKSLQAFKDSFEDFSRMEFPYYNGFIYLTVPTQCTKTVNTISSKQCSYINQQFSLADYQVQSILVLNDNLDIEKPLACIIGKTYQPLAALLARPKPSSESIVGEIIKLYQKNANCKKDSPVCNALTAQKSCKDLVTVFEVTFLQPAKSLEENIVKEAVLNLLAPVIYPQLISSQAFQDAFPIKSFSADTGSTMTELIKEYMETPTAVSSEIARRISR